MYAICRWGSDCDDCAHCSRTKRKDRAHLGAAAAERIFTVPLSQVRGSNIGTREAGIQPQQFPKEDSLSSPGMQPPAATPHKERD